MSQNRNGSNLLPSRLSKIGKVLVEDFLKPRRVTLMRLAKDCRIPVGDLFDLVEGRKLMDHFTADRLARALGTTHQFWMSLEEKHLHDQLGRMERIPDSQVFGGGSQTTSITAGFDTMTTDVSELP